MHLAVCEELLEQGGHARVTVHIVDCHQKEREGISILFGSDVDLRGGGHQRHLPPGVAEVGGVFRVVGEEEAEDVRVGGDVLGKRSAHGWKRIMSTYSKHPLSHRKCVQQLHQVS